MLVLCGLGRGFVLGFTDWPEQWRLSIICIPDLLMLANYSDREITRYLKFVKQKELVESEGMSFPIITADYDLYCYWREANYQIVPRNLSLGPESMLAVISDFILPIRKQIRNLMDRHVSAITDGTFTPVMRINSHSYYSSQRDWPIYGSLAHVRSGLLAGVVETSRGPSWFVVTSQESNKKDNYFLYKIWDGFIILYYKIVYEVESLFSNGLTCAIKICLDFSDVVISEEYINSQLDITCSVPEVEFIFDRQTAVIKFPQHFLQYFMQPENTGERLITRNITKGLICLHQCTDKNLDENILNAVIEKVIGNSDIRILHGFHVFDPVKHLQMKQNQEPIFLAQEDFVFSKLKLAENCTPNPRDTKITSKDRCNKFLHEIVIKLWNQLRKQLQRLDRTSVIREMLKINETIIQDREQWKNTARALQGLSEPTDDIQSIAQKRELDRTVTALSSRTILEMAICECPETGGSEISRWKLDEMLAKTVLLLEVTTDSDAVYNDLVKPEIEIHLNGEYTISRDFQKTVIEPFLAAYQRQGFETAVTEYSRLYQIKPPEQQIGVDEIFSKTFIHAFRTEFGLTLDNVKDGITELIELAVECGSVIVETTVGDIKTRLASNRGFSTELTETFIRTFGIYHRPTWNTPPKGFKMKDIHPWRYSRRLSVLVKPLLIFGKQDNDEVFYGVGMLQQGFEYLLTRAEKGHLPQDFFTSPDMKQYIGEANNKMGHAFERSIAEKLRVKGWQTRTEIKMTQLGAPAELGDIDVLAWKPTGEALIIECKRLQLARTVAEIAEICRRFRGEAKDELYKHIQRINWIKENPEKLRQVTGYEPEPKRIDDRLVTNTLVPMTYLKSLPISTDKIGPL